MPGSPEQVGFYFAGVGYLEKLPGFDRFYEKRGLVEI